MASLFGVMTIPVLLVIIHGAVAVNIESVYSAPLCMLAGGIKLKRWVGQRASRGIIASGVLVAFLASSTFATSFTNYMNSFVIWTAAWGAIILLDYFVINRGHTDLEALYDDPADLALRRHPVAGAGFAAARPDRRVGLGVRQRQPVPGTTVARHQRRGLLLAGGDPGQRRGLLGAGADAAEPVHGAARRWRSRPRAEVVRP